MPPGTPTRATPTRRTPSCASINAVVDSLRGQPNGAGIKYLVLVGGDRAIPFGRLEDYVSISNESGYAQSVGTNNELSAALGAGRILSDDPYADTTPVQYLNRQLFVPDLSVGRLVETPTEIVAALTRYRTFNGRLDPTTGTVFGYDFLSDGATEVRTALERPAGAQRPGERDVHQPDVDAGERDQRVAHDGAERRLAERPRRPLPVPAPVRAERAHAARSRSRRPT